MPIENIIVYLHNGKISDIVQHAMLGLGLFIPSILPNIYVPVRKFYLLLFPSRIHNCCQIFCDECTKTSDIVKYN